MNLRRVRSLLAKDLKTGLRESMIVYLLLSPFLLAFGFRLLLPILEEPRITFAVERALDAELVSALRDHGDVLVLADRDAVLERVRRLDDVPGVLAGPLPEVVLEGDEPDWVAAVPGLVLDGLGAARLQATFESQGKESSMLRGILASLLGFSMLLMGGIAMGLVVLEEKETGTLRVYVVSPVTFGEYLAAKVFGASLLGLIIGGTCMAILLGGQVPLGPTLLALLGSLPAALLLGFLIATIAQDQVAAVALLKSMLFFFTSLPVAGFFVTGLWWGVLGLFTNHWAIQALHVAIQPDGGVPWGYLGMSWLTGTPLVFGIVWLMRRKLGFAGDAPDDGFGAPAPPAEATGEQPQAA